jgi:hypothetical protein
MKSLFLLICPLMNESIPISLIPYRTYIDICQLTAEGGGQGTGNGWAGTRVSEMETR